MTNVKFLSFVLTALLAAGAASGEEKKAEERTVPLRNYDHFEFDTTTGPWFALATFFTQGRISYIFLRSPSATPEQRKRDVNVTTTEWRLVYGGKNVEFGVIIPYFSTSRIDDGIADAVNGVGDVRTYLKGIPYRGKWVDVGGGLEFIWPAGSEKKQLSTGKVGVLPWLTATAHVGPVDWNVHWGHKWLNHSNGTTASRSWIFGSSVMYPVLEAMVLRLELAGQSFANQGSNRNVIAIEPGIDYILPVGPVDVVLRAQVAAGLLNSAPREIVAQTLWGADVTSGLSRGEWGIGGAVALTWN